ncbi:MAG: hypothetical protein A2787_09955 [Omnitrophica WOR_2 bacterium RIFCSPHIGHO2_01_FULL_48_9]|nr:MAG: hypothetical protein A2787_09955 [Omnitrophica WOR_2 bacterium RIFCSPHIGHO2_01_FULL_48_9]
MRIGVNNMKPEERFTRTFCGILLILSALVSWGKWIALSVGILFLISAWLGYCATCEVYKKINKSGSN